MAPRPTTAALLAAAFVSLTCGVGNNQSSTSTSQRALGTPVTSFQIRQATTLPGFNNDQAARGPVRLVKDPLIGELVVMTLNGDIYRLTPKTTPTSRSLIYSASDTGTVQPQGFAIGPDGTFYIVDNETQGANNVPRIRRGVRQGATGDDRTWSDLVTTSGSLLSKTAFDHRWNGITVSPDGAFVYVNAGSRTGHGELHEGARETPQTARLFRFPTNTTTALTDDNASSFVFAEGIRNSFDLAFNAEGDLFGAENCGDRDDNEELNWIREGMHFGFPWRCGDSVNPMAFTPYDPKTDVLISRWSYAFTSNYFRNDPEFPPAPPVTFMPAVRNVGPDGDSFRDAKTGGLRDASALGVSMSTFTGHRSPTGLMFDTAGELGGIYKNGAFVLGFQSAASDEATGPFVDHGENLLFLTLTKNAAGTNYDMSSRVIVGGFKNPIDATIFDGKLYVLESSYNTNTDAPVWEIVLPDSPEVAASSPAATTRMYATPGNGTVAVRWDPAPAMVRPIKGSGALTFDVLRGTSVSGPFTTVGTTPLLEYQDLGLSNGTTYFYKIRSVNAVGTTETSDSVSATPFDSTDAAFAAAAPVIDGTTESAWSTAASNTIATTLQGTVSGSSDLGATWSARWDATALYVLVSVTDDVKNNDSVNVWDDDSVEVYIDGNNAKAGSYDGDDFQFVFGWNDSAVFETHGKSTAGITFARTDSSTGYQFEIRIPWSLVSPDLRTIAGRSIGFDVHVNDDDDGGDRDTKRSFHAATDQAWANPSLFTSLRLGDVVAGTTCAAHEPNVVITRASATPTIDGTADAAWSTAAVTSSGRTIVGAVAGSTDLSVTWKTLWDATNLYLFVTVVDDATRNDSVNPWEDDSVEIYVDGNNAKAGSYDSDDSQFLFGWGDTAVFETHGKSTTGVSFAKVDTATGYNVEVKIPWALLGGTGTAGRKIGLDVHVNDDDDNGDRDGKLSWWSGIDQSWTNPSLFGTAQTVACP